MDWPELAALPLAWGSNLDVSPSGPPFVIATRLLTYRNFTGFPFTVSAPPNVCAVIADKALNLLAKRRGQSIWRLSDCPPYAIRMLRERQLIPERSTPFPGKAMNKYLASAPDGKAWSLINEVEHLTFGQILPGRLSETEFSAAYRPPEETGAEEKRFPADGGRPPWVWSPKLGYLMSDPARVGSGLAVEILVHLPGLALARKLAQARNVSYAMGIGFHPIPSGSAGNVESGLFLLRSRGGSGKAAAPFYAGFLGSVQPLLDWEAELQRRCMEKHHKRLEQRARESLRLLAHARTLSYPELLAAGSFARLGAYQGILDPQIPGILEELRVTAGSGHLAVSSGAILSKEEEGFRRANVVRLTLESRRV